jgi:hypothetical protein
MNLRKILKNSFGLGLLLITVGRPGCERDSTKGIQAKSNQFHKIFVDKDGRVWHFYSNYDNDLDSSMNDANQYGI